jgi:hypothetical protein
MYWLVLLPAVILLVTGIVQRRENPDVPPAFLGFVSKVDLAISRTALAPGFQAEPLASALRLIVLRRSLVLGRVCGHDETGALSRAGELQAPLVADACDAVPSA